MAENRKSIPLVPRPRGLNDELSPWPGLLLAFAALTAACQPPPPNVVWVPAQDFEATLVVGLDDGSGKEHGIGEWIVLDAERSMGPWIQVAYENLPPKATWLRQPPPAHEEGVQANVRWVVEPSGSCQFNIPTARNIRSRMIQCNQPGIFQLWAESNRPDGGFVKSNILELVITAPDSDGLSDISSGP